MTKDQHPELDLNSTIRPGLDILANEIVIALKKRTRFVTNKAVYEPGLVVAQPDTTLLDYELKASERLHAELGRYTFAAQDAFTDISSVKPVIKRKAPVSVLRVMPSGVGSRIKQFYHQWLMAACETGDDPLTYGECVTSDVLALLAIMERVNLGKAVAESKLLERPQDFIDTDGDRNAMLKYIVREGREKDVLQMATRLAEQYDLPAEHATSVFEFMIQTTIDIELDYLQLRIAELKSQ